MTVRLRLFVHCWLPLLAATPACVSQPPHRRPVILPPNRGLVRTLAGKAGDVGYADGPGGTARFHYPTGIALDACGTLYVGDMYNNTIRSISPAGVVSTLTCQSCPPGHDDGPAAKAHFYHPAGVAVDAAGTVYVADRDNHTVRKITASGVVSTLAGQAIDRAPVDTGGNYGSTDGPAAAARFFSPTSLAVDGAGTVYVAELSNCTIRKITAAGVVSTLAGVAGSRGSADGPGPAARFYAPAGLALDAAGTLYVADEGNSTIRKITPAGVVSTLAGVAGSKGSIDGLGAAARFHWPTAVAVDAAGTVYVADQADNLIRKITPAGVVSTLAGQLGRRSSTDGLGATAGFNNPAGLAVDGNGAVYVADGSNHTIRVIRQL